MRIAMIGSRGIPARLGGVEHVVQDLARELAARGHEVLVYSRPWYVRSAPPPAAGTRILTPGLEGKHLDTFTHTATAMLDLPRRKVDVAHIHSPGPAALGWMAAVSHIPIVFTVHAADWRRDKWSLAARAALHAGLSCGMRVASAVTAVSRGLSQELAARFGREVVHVPNGVAPVRPRAPKAIRRWGLARDGYVLYVGRIVPEKRLGLLLAAWPRVGGERPLVVTGDAGCCPYARACRRDAPANVVFTGPQFGETLAELYSNAAMIVLPSALEGASLVLLTAAAYGRCVLAADIPANREILEDCGLYFTLDDISELATRIRRSLQSEDLRRRLGQEARRRVTGLYSTGSAAERMERIYLNLPGRGRARG